jgi:hypothetical protein
MQRRKRFQNDDVAAAILALTPAAAATIALLVGAWLAAYAP